MRGAQIAWAFAAGAGALSTLVVGLMVIEETSVGRSAPPVSAEAATDHSAPKRNTDSDTEISSGEDASPATQGAEIDFSYFKQGAILKAFHEGDHGYLANNERLVLMYLGPLNASLSQQAIYAGDPLLLQVLDDSIGPSADRKMATSSNAHNQAIETTANVIGNMIGAYEKYSSGEGVPPGSLGEVSADISKSMIPEGYMTIEQITGDATTDGRRLIALYQQSPEDFDKIYSSIIKYVSNR